MIKLRDYQTKIIDDVRSLFFNGVKRVLVQAPTGSGKTAIMAHVAKTSADQGMTTWFVVHRRELVKQSLKAFELEGINAGVVSADWPRLHYAKAQICSIQTIIRCLGAIKKPHLVCFDECHHVAARSWMKVFNFVPEAFKIGLTATPERLDGHGLKDYFDKIVSGPSIQSLTDQGFLSPYKLYAPSGIDLSGVRTQMGDYVKSDLSTAADKPTITGNAISEYLKLAPGKRAVVFCVSLEHSRHVVEQFNAAGIKAEHVDGESSIQERDGAIERFARGETLVLSNVDLFGEGFDLPAIEVAILLRPTQSLALYLQQVGRSLRPFPGKSSAVILDHAGNCERHGLPDEDRQWSLEGHRDKKKSVQQVRIKVCPKCYAAMPTGSSYCKYCGYVFTAQEREVAHAEGNLAEVDVAAIKKRRAWEVARAQSYEDLVAIGRARNYSRPEAWAKIQYDLRQRKVLNRK